jgi:hypothetical protein
MLAVNPFLAWGGLEQPNNGNGRRQETACFAGRKRKPAQEVIHKLCRLQRLGGKDKKAEGIDR